MTDRTGSDDHEISARPVGFVGTGAMGTAMVHRLLEVGHQVVVHNRTRANARDCEAAGAVWAPTLEAVVAQSALILSCMRDSDAVEAVYLAAGGLLDAEAVPGRVFVEHGTFAPALARRVAEVAAERGAAFLAAPVSGGPEGARAGSLAVMVGGQRSAYLRAEPVLASLAGQLSRVGGPGAGLELKVVNQLLTSSHMAVAGEAVALLRRLGIDLDTAGSLLNRGWAQSAMLARTIDLVTRDRITGTGATIQGMAEVLDLVGGVLRENQLDAPVFTAGQQTFKTAANGGLGQADPASLFTLNEEK